MALDSDAIVEGVKDGLNGTSELTKEALNQIMKDFQQDQMDKQRAAYDDMSEKNQKEATSFLADNKSKSGVITTKSGLQYKVDKRGKGTRSPKETDTVVVHYKGTLLDGTEFDSSYKRNQPATFPLNRVIKGWTEALQLMPVGSKWRLYIPENLAYGANPHPGGPIKPYMALIFDVELISIA